eukprot:TRINITY_DN9748_c1_g1_i1.p1 TRINITY_DN9748_c1_g1~~TRINITY_DN9748_c1_g1_i1.p1  ORF type:complete len:187 (+),score=-31.55 TRINITY_DN9748_c1_g1_i1:2-562(+)
MDILYYIPLTIDIQCCYYILLLLLLLHSSLKSTPQSLQPQQTQNQIQQIIINLYKKYISNTNQFVLIFPKNHYKYQLNKQFGYQKRDQGCKLPKCHYKYFICSKFCCNFFYSQLGQKNYIIILTISKLIKYLYVRMQGGEGTRQYIQTIYTILLPNSIYKLCILHSYLMLSHGIFDAQKCSHVQQF